MSSRRGFLRFTLGAGCGAALLEHAFFRAAHARVLAPDNGPRAIVPRQHHPGTWELQRQTSQMVREIRCAPLNTPYTEIAGRVERPVRPSALQGRTALVGIDPRGAVSVGINRRGAVNVRVIQERRSEPTLAPSHARAAVRLH